MTSLKKVLISLGSAGAITGLAVGSYYLSKLKSPKNIRDKLLKEGLTPLDTNAVSDKDDSKWTVLVKKHADPANNSKKIKNLPLSSNANQKPIPTDIIEIKNKCRSLLSTPVSSEEDFETDLQNARDWCTKESEFAKE
ncbi:hypothetical protein A6V39_00260 [Candidatus Mycoplasma haematobovis]|uniref:Uncharacterized protein n=1 Tax=Candidatus Mycoplasma haematobovis TaxID=432608 RepID=A0A1A9QD18_9MOLU|nr:hypothetical protein [Candidatus Mycoplasma haematobovis]OAL10482.1 hypothetical protein A6V39_00260 [Candidatus Mycoplasma haematobovis]